MAAGILKKAPILIALILLCPITGSRPDDLATDSTAAISRAEQQQPQAFTDYMAALVSEGKRLEDQGVLIETLDGRLRLAEHNPDFTFNPASVMKLATSLVALAKFSPDYRYRTNFLADGAIDLAARRLDGDLVIEGNADPMFSLADAQEVAQELSRLGVSRVTGALKIAGPFYYFANGYRSNLSPETSASKLRAALQQSGIKIDGQILFGEKSGALIVSHYSEQLIRILLFQNAHSSNAVAEVVGESVGGPLAIQNFLVRKLGLPHSEIYVGRASGLDFNRITPRASLKALRALFALLGKYSLKPEDAMPVAGVDAGTLRARLSGEQVRGSVVAKTGTLVSTDDGVSTLVGIAYTKAHGPVLFAIFNSEGSVRSFRKLQDKFIEQLIAEEGGPVPTSRQADALADVTRNSIVQVFNTQAPPAENNAD